MPANAEIAPGSFVASSYAFTGFASQCRVGLRMGVGAGIYEQCALLVGPRGQVDVGDYTCLNSVTIVCNERVSIGAHVFIAWGAVLCDSWPARDGDREARRLASLAAAADPTRPLPAVHDCRPVTIEDCAWVGFASVVLPGVTIGRGAVVGARSVVTDDVPPYAVVAGDPVRLLRYLTPEERHEQSAIADRPLVEDE